MQGTRVRALVREDPTCRGATKPVCHNYWAWVPQLLSSATREATAMRSPRTATKSSPRSPQLEKVRVQQWRPNTVINEWMNEWMNEWIELPYDPAIPLLGIYPKNMKTLIQKDICTSMFITTSLTIAKIWKQPKHPSTDKWIKMWDMYTMEYYSAIKRWNLAICHNTDGPWGYYAK